MNYFIAFLIVSVVLALIVGPAIGKLNPMEHGGPLPTDEDREFIIGDKNGQK